MKELSTDLLIVGAGPFGLALAAFAQEHGIRHLVVGTPMEFWQVNMPRGMFLRSTCDWSLDPVQIHSIDAYLDTLGRRCSEVEPLSRDFYLDYTGWFQAQKDIHSKAATVSSLISGDGDLVAVTEGGERIHSRSVVLATGFSNFAHVPEELAQRLPRERCDHTCDLVEFERLEDRRVLIIGGRQSAFEWAALLRESGAAEIHVCYRHDTPAFTEADWSWVTPIVERMADDPGWYPRLTADEKKDLNHRLWKEGRLKLEPWLASRIDHANVHLHPRTTVAGADVADSGMSITLDNGEELDIDQVIFATGYKVELANVPLLANGLLGSVRIDDGSPVLDEHFQTSVPGLYMTSLAATRDFGSFLGFTVSARAQAQIIGRDIRERLKSAAGSSAFVTP